MESRLAEFSGQTTTAMGNAQIWLPKEASPKQREVLIRAFTKLSNTAEQLVTTPINQLETIQTIFDQVLTQRTELANLISEASLSKIDPDFARIRMDDLSDMKSAITTHRSLLTMLQKSRYQAIITQLQGELNAESSRTVLGLSDELTTLSGVSVEIDQAITDLTQLLEVELLDNQKSVSLKLESLKPSNAIALQNKVARQFEEGVKLLDFAIVAFVKAQSEIERPAPRVDPGPEEEVTPAEDPTEQQIERALQEALANLEKEAREEGEEKLSLGLAAESNLKIKSDWEKEQPPQTAEEQEKKRREMNKTAQKQKQKARQAQRTAAHAQQSANQAGQRIAQVLEKKVGVPWRDQQTANFKGNITWNKIASTLQQSLTQDAESDIPEEHRESIQQYFRDISEINKE